MDHKLKLMVVDDSPLFRTWLIRSLSEDDRFQVVGYAINAFDAQEKIPKLQPDMLTLDIEMPGMSGIDFLKQLLPVHPIPVILVSSLNLRVFDALEAGAVDFVRKPDEANGLSKEIFLSTLRSKLMVAAASHVHLPSAPADPQAGGIRKVSSLPPARNTFLQKPKIPLGASPETVIAIGASTGGFTDCMLQNGATKVYSVDVGQGQLAWKLRNDERVVCMEQTNFRYVTPEDIPDALDFASVDVSFISLTKILIPARNLLKTGGQMVCLIKPQFEAGRGKVGKNGVVREPQIHEEVIRKIIDYADSIGFEVLHLEYSPIKGPEGNIEYLLHIRKPEEISEEKLALTEHEAESALQTIIEEKTGLSYTPEWDAVIKGIVDNSHTL